MLTIWGLATRFTMMHREGNKVRQANSSVQTLNSVKVLSPNVCVSGTSAASRPCAIRILANLDEPCSQMIDEPQLRADHVGDQSLQDAFVGQHTPFEIGRLRSQTCKSFRLCHGLLRTTPNHFGIPCVVQSSSSARQACAILRFGASVPGMVDQPAAMSASRR